jgi:hypothetical protein
MPCQGLLLKRPVRLQICEPGQESRQKSVNLQKRLLLEKKDKKILKAYVNYNETIPPYFN